MGGFLYPIVRPVARFVLGRFYRNIDITGLENIPKSGAVILAANHPTAFIEPCVLACFQHRNLHFLARGDLYKNRLANVVLRSLNVLPVYRMQDGGFGKLRNNYDTFAECYRALSRGKAVMILAEGRCIHEKALRPLRKGTARIALGALDGDPALKEVSIVPVGVNFTAAGETRSTIMIRCGEAIPASTWLADYRRAPTPALTALTSHLRERLSPLVVQHPGPAAVGELYLTAARSALPPRRGITNDGRQLDTELAAARTPQDTHIAEQVAAELHRLKLNAGAVAGAMNGLKSTTVIPNGKMHAAKLCIAFLLQLPLLPFILLAGWIAETKTNFVEFYQPVRFAALALCLIAFVPIAAMSLPFLLALVWIVAPLLTLGKCLSWRDDWKRYKDLKDWERTVAADRERIESLYGRVSNAVKEKSAVQ